MIIQTHKWLFTGRTTMFHGAQGDKVYYHTYHCFCPHCGARKQIRVFEQSRSKMLSYNTVEKGHTDKLPPCKIFKINDSQETPA